MTVIVKVLKKFLGLKSYFTHSIHMRNRICVVILNSNQKADTLACLKSLSAVDYPLFTPIVADSGSTDDSISAIRAAYPRVPIFEAAGNNTVIDWALKKPFKWILLLSNQAVVAPHFLKSFIETSNEYPATKLFGAKIYAQQSELAIHHCGGQWDEETLRLRSIGAGCEDDGFSYEESSLVDYVSSEALFLHRNVAETIGLFEPTLSQGWQDIDYCFRAHRKGFETRTAPRVHLWLKNRPPQESPYHWWRSRLFFLQRNLHPKNRKQAMQQTIHPELYYLCRDYLRSLFSRSIATEPLKAGLLGACHFYLKKV